MTSGAEGRTYAEGGFNFQFGATAMCFGFRRTALVVFLLAAIPAVGQVPGTGGLQGTVFGLSTQSLANAQLVVENQAITHGESDNICAYRSGQLSTVNVLLSNSSVPQLETLESFSSR